MNIQEEFDGFFERIIVASFGQEAYKAREVFEGTWFTSLYKFYATIENCDSEVEAGAVMVSVRKQLDKYEKSL